MADQYGTPIFVTDKRTIENRVHSLKDAFNFKSSLYYAVKANYNPEILRILKSAGVDGVDTVSEFEVKLAIKCGFRADQIIFTGNNSTDEELASVSAEGVLLNVGSLSELKRLGKIARNGEVSIRFNPGIGDGEFDSVITGGSNSKFGILSADLPEAKRILKEFSLKLKGIHCHIGSGYYTTDIFENSVRNILQEASAFPDLDFVDIGGGFGVRYDPSKKPININAFGSAVRKHVDNFSKINGREIEIRLEPGKFLVAESTCLLTRITTVKRSGNITFVGTDTGFNHIIRPAMYDAVHHIVKLSNSGGQKERVTVVGNICESTDVFAKDIELDNPQEGDIIAILTAGAYCASMSSVYNLRPYAAEVMVDGDEYYLTRRNMKFEDLFDGLGFV